MVVKLPAIVDDAFEIKPLVYVWSDAHVFAVERSVSPETRHVPFTEKQPEAMFTPFAAVVVADPAMLRLATERLPEKVEVELAPTTLMTPWIVEVPVVLPC